MNTITLRNDFHGTEARLRPRPDGTISAASYRKARRALCSGECMCLSSPASGKGVLPLVMARPIYEGAYLVAYRLWEGEGEL